MKLNDIFNVSLSQGVFPEVFKQANVIPLLKKASLDERHLSNYRPVSTLTYLSKQLERLVADHLNEHIVDIGQKFESAYRSYHSTESALLCV